MIVIVMTVCAINAASQCGEARLQFAGEALTPLQCTNQAMPYIARYIGEHPNLRVAKWHCAYPESEGDPA